jgi:hypothetical protein
MKHFAVLVILILLNGCAGKMYTVLELKPDALGRIEGVIVYQPRTLVLGYATTHFQDEKGKIVGSSADFTCIPILSYEIIYAPDYGKKSAIYYDAGLLETKKFSLELDKGVLYKLNYESTSTAKEALDVVQGIIGTAKEISIAIPKGIQPPAGEKPPCNVGKSVVSIDNIEDILKKGIPKEGPKKETGN